MTNPAEDNPQPEKPEQDAPEGLSTKFETDGKEIHVHVHNHLGPLGQEVSPSGNTSPSSKVELQRGDMVQVDGKGDHKHILEIQEDGFAIIEGRSRRVKMARVSLTERPEQTQALQDKIDRLLAEREQSKTQKTPTSNEEKPEGQKPDEDKPDADNTSEPAADSDPDSTSTSEATGVDTHDQDEKLVTEHELGDVRKGDLVQWVSQETEQFSDGPKEVLNIEADPDNAENLFAFVEGVDTGIPVGQLVVKERPQGIDAELDALPAETEAPAETAAEKLARVKAEADALAAKAKSSGAESSDTESPEPETAESETGATSSEADETPQEFVKGEVQEGDLVQWSHEGTDLFSDGPRRIIGFEANPHKEGGQVAVFEGTQVRVPVEYLITTKRPTAEELAAAATETPTPEEKPATESADTPDPAAANSNQSPSTSPDADAYTIKVPKKAVRGTFKTVGAVTAAGLFAVASAWVGIRHFSGTITHAQHDAAMTQAAANHSSEQQALQDQQNTRLTSLREEYAGKLTQLREEMTQAAISGQSPTTTPAVTPVAGSPTALLLPQGSPATGPAIVGAPGLTPPGSATAHTPTNSEFLARDPITGFVTYNAPVALYFSLNRAGQISLLRNAATVVPQGEFTLLGGRPADNALDTKKTIQIPFEDLLAAALANDNAKFNAIAEIIEEDVRQHIGALTLTQQAELVRYRVDVDKKEVSATSDFGADSRDTDGSGPDGREFATTIIHGP